MSYDVYYICNQELSLSQTRAHNWPSAVLATQFDESSTADQVLGSLLATHLDLLVQFHSLTIVDKLPLVCTAASVRASNWLTETTFGSYFLGRARAFDMSSEATGAVTAVLQASSGATWRLVASLTKHSEITDLFMASHPP
jgi:hypothetical protein